MRDDEDEEGADETNDASGDQKETNVIQDTIKNLSETSGRLFKRSDELSIVTSYVSQVTLQDRVLLLMQLELKGAASAASTAADMLDHIMAGLSRIIEMTGDESVRREIQDLLDYPLGSDPDVE